jgi:hypothetical protein
MFEISFCRPGTARELIPINAWPPKRIVETQSTQRLMRPSVGGAR